MKAMILAAGRGMRMGELCDNTPKPLLTVNDKTLIEYQLAKIAAANITEVVINLAYLGEKIRNHLCDGKKYGVTIQYSDEGDTALETAGGIIQALPLLGSQAFLIVNADVWCDIDLAKLKLPQGSLAHLVLVDAASHNPKGDFALEQGLLLNQAANMHTYAGLGIYHPDLFAGLKPGKRALVDVLRPAADRKKISAQYYPGTWMDIGTPERLAALRQTAK